MDLNINPSELEIFLSDISVYLKNELQLFQYENTLSGSNELICKDLLIRCEKLLKETETKKLGENSHSKQLTTKLTDQEECSYLDMSVKRKATPSEYVDFSGTLPPDIDTNNDEDTDDDDKEIYDTCNTSLQQTIKTATDDNETIDCPYTELPASHLSNIQKPSKQGQLIRIEKRLFFDQTKKLYCGIVEDWLLCYGEGLSSVRPLFCVKLNKIEVEHTGEGKRRDLCFQIINSDTGKRFVFQATSDIDSKEWIHAIEAAIRGGFTSVNTHESAQILKTLNINNNWRKLPTPPVQNKIYTPRDTLNEDIYEEPCPLYINSNLPTENIKAETDEIPPILPAKTDRLQKNRNNVVNDYDVPKSLTPIICSETSATITAMDALRNKTEFQTKVKDVHSKLTNQLSSGLSPTKIKKSPQLSPITDIKGSGKLSLIYNKDKATISSNPANGSTPVKNWFFNRLNKSTSSSSGNSSNYCSKSSPNKQEKENLLSHDNSNNNAINFDCAKGGKVNMIINHLEANGHMPIFKGNFERSNISLIDNIDDCNYEPIMASGNLKS